MKTMTWIAVTAFISLSGVARAELVAPDEMVKHVASEVLEIVKNDKDIQNGDTKKINALAEEKILPHFDFGRMSQITLGKNWEQASPGQRIAFVNQFRTLIIRTYPLALSKYNNQTIEYKPFRAQPGETEAKVQSVILQSGGEAIPVDYSLARRGDEWKVFDVTIDGISLASNYRGQFNSEISQNGIEGLIQKLAEKNRSQYSGTGQKVI